MRIVALSDTHMFQQDLGVLPDGDMLIFAGDLLRGGTQEELKHTAPWLQAQPHRHKLFVAGNHDRCFEDDPSQAKMILGKTIHYLQDEWVTLNGLTFYGSPWQPAFNDWAFNLQRGAPLRRKWSKIPDHTDILITHGPPKGYGDASPTAGRHGCDDLLNALDRVQPLLHLFGHIHNDGGCWTRGATTLANVTTWESERAPSVFDVHDGQVTRVHIPPTSV